MEKMKYLNKDEYQEILIQQYNEAEAADIIDLLKESKNNLLDVLESNIHPIKEKAEFIHSIIIHAAKYRVLSFKQWKALKAFNRDYNQQKSNNLIKKF